MPILLYRAIDQHGLIHTGSYLAKDHAQLEHYLSDKGWNELPMGMFERLYRQFKQYLLRSKWSRTDAMLFTLHLRQLLGAGVSLIDALTALIELEPRRSIATVLMDVRDNVNQGKSLSYAMAQHTALFDADTIAVIHAAEASGELVACLTQLEEHLRWHSGVIERTKTALAYPLFSLVTLLSMLLFLLLYLVPALQPFLLSTEQAIPVYTQWLFSLSSMIMSVGLFSLLLTIAVVFVVCVLLFNHPYSKRQLSRLLSNNPYGRVTAAFALSRYAKSVGLLYASGVELGEALQISQETLQQGAQREQLEEARLLILKGKSVADALRLQPVLPALFIHMVAAGELAGQLADGFTQAGLQLQTNAQHSLERLERLSGPVLLCLMGGMMLWVILAVVGPLYSTLGHTGMPL